MFNHFKSGFENDLEPAEFYLSPNYPNPFNKMTKIKYCVAYTTKVRLIIFDSEGKEIIRLVDEEKQAGTYEVDFSIDHCKEYSILDGKVYYCRLEAGEYKSERKMIYKNNF
jgi:hypothetical protein